MAQSGRAGLLTHWPRQLSQLGIISPILPIGVDGHVDATVQNTAVTSALPTGFTFDGTQFCLMEVSFGSGTTETTITTPSGWTKIPEVIGLSTKNVVFWRFLQLGDTAPSFTLSTSRAWTAHSTAFAFVDTTTPIDTGLASGLDYAAATSYASSSITPSGDRRMLVACWGGKTGTGATQTVTVPFGWLDTVGGASSPYTPFQSAIAAINNQWSTFQYQRQGVAALSNEGVAVANSATAQGFILALNPATVAAPQTISPTSITSSGVSGVAVASPGAATISPVSVTSTELFSAITSSLVIAPVAISSSQLLGQSVLAQVISLAGILSSEAEGNFTTSLFLVPAGIQTSELLGTLAVSSVAGAQTVSPVGIRSLEVSGSSVEIFGTSAVFVTQTIAPMGIRSLEVFGLPFTSLSVSPAAILSAEVLGQTSAVLFVSPNSVVSQEMLGQVSSALSVSPNGITTAEQFGAMAVAPGAITISSSGISSGEQLGSAVASLFVSPVGVSSPEQFGAVSTGQAIAPVGIVSVELLGTLLVSPGAVTIAPFGVITGEKFGSVSVSGIAIQTVSPSGIFSTEKFGAQVFSPGVATISPNGIVSGEFIGIVTSATFVSPVGVRSFESFGISSSALGIAAFSVPDKSQIGAAVVSPGAVTIAPNGVVSQESFGSTISSLVISPVAVRSSEMFSGVATTLEIVAFGISDQDQVGWAVVVPGALAISPGGIVTSEYFGVMNAILGDIPAPLLLKIKKSSSSGAKSSTLVLGPKSTSKGL